MYVFARLLLLNFVSDASFVHPSLEVEDNYTAVLPLPSYPKLLSKSPLVPLLVPPFHSLAPALGLPPTRTSPELPILFHHRSLSSSLDILGQITLLAAPFARCF